MAVFQHRQRRGAVVGLIGVGEAQVTQQVLDDPPHRRKVVNDEDFHVFVQVDLQAVSNALGPERAFNQFGTTWKTAWKQPQPQQAQRARHSPGGYADARHTGCATG